MAIPSVALKNVVIVGTGMVSATHLAAICDLRDKVRLIGVLSRSELNAQAFAHDWHTAIIDDFVESLVAGRSPLVSGREALRVHHLIDGLVSSSAQKCLVAIHTAVN